MVVRQKIGLTHLEKKKIDCLVDFNLDKNNLFDKMSVGGNIIN